MKEFSCSRINFVFDPAPQKLIFDDPVLRLKAWNKPNYNVLENRFHKPQHLLDIIAKRSESIIDVNR